MADKITKSQYLDFCFRAKHYLDRNWILGLITITNFSDRSLQWVVQREPTYVYFLNESNEQVIISDASNSEPLFNIYDKIEVLYGIISNVEVPTITTVGNLLYNACSVDYAFGKKLGYLNSQKECNIKSIEKTIAQRLVSGLAPEDNKDPSKLYIDEYLRFVEGADYLQGFNMVWTQCVTEAILKVPTGNAELKAKLVAEAGSTIGKPAVLAKIYEQLDANDKEFLKGDPSNKFTNGKIKVARRKMFQMQGGEGGLKGGDNYDIATNSLLEGLEKSKFAVYNDVLRAGSLFRGLETQLGGVKTKELIRATSNIKVVSGDCGTKLGRLVLVDETNYERQLAGLYFTDATGKLTLVKDKKQAGTYLGKIINRRSPQYCHAKDENFCEYCVGTRLSLHPTGVSMAVTEIGGTLLGIFMSMMHAKELKVHRVSLDSITQ